MQFDKYQERAMDTDRTSALGNDPIQVALLGLAGELGSIHTLYKKRLRDGRQFPDFVEKVSEELGDLLWYLAAIAHHEKLSLSAIATENLQKAASRWLPNSEDEWVSFDEHFPAAERLPRNFTAEFRHVEFEGRVVLRVFIEGEPWGSPLTDNSYDNDGYRFHDVFHMTCAAMLGWSPVVRALMRRKRKSDPGIDEVEDGGRAIVAEEAVAAVVFSYAVKQKYLEDIKVLDWSLLDMCHALTSGLEVARRSLFDWEQVILTAFTLWREVRDGDGGTIRFDLNERTAAYIRTPAE